MAKTTSCESSLRDHRDETEEPLLPPAAPEQPNTVASSQYSPLTQPQPSTRDLLRAAIDAHFEKGKMEALRLNVSRKVLANLTTAIQDLERAVDRHIDIQANCLAKYKNVEERIRGTKSQLETCAEMHRQLDQDPDLQRREELDDMFERLYEVSEGVRASIDELLRLGPEFEEMVESLFEKTNTIREQFDDIVAMKG